MTGCAVTEEPQGRLSPPEGYRRTPERVKGALAALASGKILAKSQQKQIDRVIKDLAGFASDMKKLTRTRV
jgi:hypothetical protein